MVLLYAAPFNYQGFNWYLGNPGASCDDTCNNLEESSEFNIDKIFNVALEASKHIHAGDYTLIEHFSDSGKMELTQKNDCTVRSEWSFGNFYNTDNVYHGTCYGNSSTGTLPGENNRYPDRRIICPCSVGKHRDIVILR